MPPQWPRHRPVAPRRSADATNKRRHQCPENHRKRAKRTKLGGQDERPSAVSPATHAGHPGILTRDQGEQRIKRLSPRSHSAAPLRAERSAQTHLAPRARYKHRRRAELRGATTGLTRRLCSLHRGRPGKTKGARTPRREKKRGQTRTRRPPHGGAPRRKTQRRDAKGEATPRRGPGVADSIARRQWGPTTGAPPGGAGGPHAASSRPRRTRP